MPPLPLVFAQPKFQPTSLFLSWLFVYVLVSCSQLQRRRPSVETSTATIAIFRASALMSYPSGTFDVEANAGPSTGARPRRVLAHVYPTPSSSTVFLSNICRHFSPVPSYSLLQNSFIGMNSPNTGPALSPLATWTHFL